MHNIALTIKIRTFIIFVVALFCISSSSLAHAESTQDNSPPVTQRVTSTSALTADQQIATLTTVLEKLIKQYEQLLSAESKSKKSKTTIKILNPENQTVTLGDPIIVKWKYKNAPKNTQVVYSMTLIKNIPHTVFNSITYGTGTTITKLKKSGTGKVTWKTGGANSGYMNTPGVYRIDASIRDCHPQGCGMNAYFPGLNLPIKTYAQAEPITVTVIEPLTTKDYSKSGVQLLSPQSGTYKIGDKMIIQWKNNGLPKGSKVCARLQNANNKTFTFTDDNDYCMSSILMKEINTFSGTLIRNAGYNLLPGKYRVLLDVTKPSNTPVSAGKEGGGTRDTEVGGWFDIL